MGQVATLVYDADCAMCRASALWLLRRAMAGGELEILPCRSAPRRTRFPQISDEGPDGVVLSGAPARASAYTLLVLTVDAERDTVTKTQYYAGTVSNLVKLRRDRGWVRRGRRRFRLARR